jgi:RNA polymerase sigma-70 factor (ECF subfamily)
MKCSDVNLGEGTVSRTSSSLLRRAQADDSDAWQLLVQTYSRRVYRWCRRAGLQPADASNVVQEVLRSVARKLADFRRDKPEDTFRGWLRRITQNKLHDHFRQQARRVDRARGGTDAHMRLVNQGQPESSDSRSEKGLRTGTERYQVSNPIVAKVRNEFSERDWRFFWRIVVDGQTAVEVGKEFAVTANTVRLVKMRIMRRLREEFAAKASSHVSVS